MAAKTTETKFTPGPWVVEHRPGEVSTGYVPDDCEPYDLASAKIVAPKVPTGGKRRDKASGEWVPAPQAVTEIIFDDRPGRFCRTDEHLANAALIAAAPDLYHQLETVLRSIELVGECLGDMDGMRAALAKARGESA